MEIKFVRKLSHNLSRLNRNNLRLKLNVWYRIDFLKVIIDGVMLELYGLIDVFQFICRLNVTLKEKITVYKACLKRKKILIQEWVYI